MCRKSTTFQSTPSVWRETTDCEQCSFLPEFQSTPSVWRETTLVGIVCFTTSISIHSLRVEGDGLSVEQVKQLPISIHSLRVEGDEQLDSDLISAAFISIHSLRVEGDSMSMVSVPKRLDFNPLPPCGGRLGFVLVNGNTALISIHSLRVEGDGFFVVLDLLIHTFQSTPSVWRETKKTMVFINIVRFQSTPSVWRETF